MTHDMTVQLMPECYCSQRIFAVLYLERMYSMFVLQEMTVPLTL